MNILGKMNHAICIIYLKFNREKQWLDSLMVKGLTKHWVSEVRSSNLHVLFSMKFDNWNVVCCDLSTFCFVFLNFQICLPSSRYRALSRPREGGGPGRSRPWTNSLPLELVWKNYLARNSISCLRRPYEVSIDAFNMSLHLSLVCL